MTMGGPVGGCRGVALRSNTSMMIMRAAAAWTSGLAVIDGGNGGSSWEFE